MKTVTVKTTCDLCDFVSEPYEDPERVPKGWNYVKLCVSWKSKNPRFTDDFLVCPGCSGSDLNFVDTKPLFKKLMAHLKGKL